MLVAYLNDSSTEIYIKNNKFFIASINQEISINNTIICPECREKLIPCFCTMKRQHFRHYTDNEGCNNKYHDVKSEWHRNWQEQIDNCTPAINIEVNMKNEDYNKRLDQLTLSDIRIEYQKSTLSLKERLIREEIYTRNNKILIWVIHKNLENSRVFKYNSNNNIIILIDNENGFRLLEINNKFYIEIDKFKNLVINNIKNNTYIFKLLEHRKDPTIYKVTNNSPNYNLLYSNFIPYLEYILYTFKIEEDKLKEQYQLEETKLTNDELCFKNVQLYEELDKNYKNYIEIKEHELFINELKEKAKLKQYEEQIKIREELKKLEHEQFKLRERQKIIGTHQQYEHNKHIITLIKISSNSKSDYQKLLKSIRLYEDEYNIENKFINKNSIKLKI